MDLLSLSLNDAAGVVAVVDFDRVCWYVEWRPVSVSPDGVLVPDHKPLAGDTAPLIALCMNREFEPELMVRLIELFRVLYGSPIEKGASDGVLAVEDPVNRRR